MKFPTAPLFAVGILSAGLLIQSPLHAQSSGSLISERKVAAGGEGLNSLDEQRLLSELANRGLDTLLDKAFEVNNVPKDEQDGIRTLLALNELANPESKLSARQRQELVGRVVAGIEKALPTIKDPQMLMQQASVLIRYGVERDVNTLEYWGDNPRTQAILRPIVESVIKILERTATQAEAAANDAANKISSVNDQAAVDRWQAMDNLTTSAVYTKHMVDYYLALSLDKADPKRTEVADKAIEYLKQFDNADSTVQPIVRNRIAKLHMVKGDYAEAKKLFDSVAAGTEVAPEPSVAEQYEARYFSVVCDMFQKNIDAATSGLAALLAWQKTALPQEEAAQAGAAAAGSMLEYRILSAQADAATDPSAKQEATNKAIGVLVELVKARPELQGIIYEQLMAKMPENPDVKQLDPLLLQALIQKGEQERLKPDDEQPDAAAIERAIAAARELIGRKGQPAVDATMVDNAAILVPFFHETIGQHAQAVQAFLDYIEQFPANKQRHQIALENAMAILGQLRATAKDDPATADAYERFLPVAINPPFNRKELAFEYARRLQQLGKFKEALAYFAQVPADDPRTLQSKYFQMVAMKQLLDNAGPSIAEAERSQLLGSIQALASEVGKGANAAMAATQNPQEKQAYKSMVVRTALLAADIARREQKDPKQALAILQGFEESVKGLPREGDLLGEALFLRVQSFMSLGQNTEATGALVQLLGAQEGGKGADVVFTLLQKLNADLDQARAANDAPRIAELARNRAVLSGFLVDEAKRNPKMQQYAYRYSVFDAATKQLAAELETDPAKRKEGLELALARYKELESPENVKQYQASVDKAKADPNYPDPQVSLGIGLVQFALGNYKEAQTHLGKLLTDRKLGTPTMVVEDNGEQKIVDNDQYWEATYKLIKSNHELAKSNSIPEQIARDNENYLKRLYVQWGEKVGGAKWSPAFAELRKEMIPDFKPEDLTAPTGTPPVAAGAGEQ